MKLIKQNVRLVALLISLLLISLVVYGGYSVATYGSRWFSSRANTYLRTTKANVTAGNILDRNNVLLASTDATGRRIYHQDEDMRRSLVHALGDSGNKVAYGAETFMASYLYAFNESYFERLAQAFTGTKRRGNDIQLSLDSALSKRAHSLFPKDKRGAVVVLNYRTGEVLALQSYPNFDPMNLDTADRNNPLGPFWNRATKWVSAPGSTFKVITYASAIKNLPDALEREFDCQGALVLEDTTITDAGSVSHGKLNLKKALAVSCNISFAQLALELKDTMLGRTAADFGFGDHFLFSDLVVEDSSYPSVRRSEKELAWTGPGQSRLQASPMHMCMVAAGIANDGQMMEPKLLLRARNVGGGLRYSYEPRPYRRAISQRDAESITEAMREVVLRGTGTRANVSGLKICGKTGSAQIDGQQETNAWFVGFIDDPRFPYSLCVVVEDAGSGGAVAAPIAGELFRYLSRSK